MKSPGLVTLHWTAWCHTCPDTPPPGADADRWADRHTRATGHPTGSAGLPTNHQGEHVNQPEPGSAASADPADLESAIAEIVLDHLQPPKYRGGSWTINPHKCAASVMAVLRERGVVQ